ncbi:MAG: glycosyltransferase family 9 protein, partial [Kiritimatiellia bacterium]
MIEARFSLKKRPIFMKPDQKTFRSPLNYMLAFGTECVRPLVKSAARLFCSSPPTSPPEWRRGILIGADHIGDLLWLTPSLPALQAGLPGCEWYVVASAPGREVLEGNPYVKRVIAPRLPREKIYCDRALMVEMRALRPDVALCYDSGDYWRGLLMALRCEIPNRVAYTHKGFSGLITLPVRIEFPQPYPAYFRGLVAQLAGAKNNGQLRPVVYPTTEDCAAAEKVWEEIRPPTGKPVVAVFPTSRQQYGTWPPERFGAAVA